MLWILKLSLVLCGFMEKEFLYINSRDELLRIDISQIVYFEANGNYTNIVVSNKLKSLANMNLAQTEKALETRLKEKASIFARVGKRFIVNLNYVYHINLTKQALVLTDYKNFVFQLPISKEALRKLKDIYLKTQS